MERYSLIVVADETAPIRRFDIRKSVVHRALWGVGLLSVLLMAGLVDYVALRVEQPEFVFLKAEATEQRARIADFEATLADVDQKLEQVKEFERKIRIIANLPGSAATGGGGIAEVTPGTTGDLDAAQLDAGAPPATREDGGDLAIEAAASISEPHASAAATPADAGSRVSVLREEAERLGLVAESRGASIKDLVDQLESKHRRLASSPAIWPTDGWLTSRYGYRISPFTNRKHFHSGIDVAGALGSPVIAPARGKVTFAGKRGPLGLTVIIDHGYGLRTFFGHSDKLFVKRGEEIVRGQKIATLGNTGRSTGPHLHYAVEVNGKARNPLDYIFD